MFHYLLNMNPPPPHLSGTLNLDWKTPNTREVCSRDTLPHAEVLEWQNLMVRGQPGRISHNDVLLHANAELFVNVDVLLISYYHITFLFIYILLDVWWQMIQNHTHWRTSDALIWLFHYDFKDALSNFSTLESATWMDAE